MLRLLYALYLLISLNLSGFTAGLPEVQLGGTTVSGLSLTEFNLEFFGGIPYAEPPVGPLRFAPPVLKLSPGVPTLNATHFGDACAQFTGRIPIPISFNLSVADDCLSLNVFRPAGVDDTVKLPIMFWVTGGGFYGGASSLYNASTLVARSVELGTPIIYVNINYRVGPLGYPQGMEAEALNATNLGHKDVITALKWVRNNIAAFGGDKDKITIFGESAGSIMTSHFFLNESFDLARAAIFQSGSANTLPLLHASDNEDIWQTFVSGVPECSNATSTETFDCLRSATLETIIDAGNLMYQSVEGLFPVSPVIDGLGGLIPDLPSRLYKCGEFSRLPFIAGTNLDEGTGFVPTGLNSSDLLRHFLFTNTTPPVVSPEEQTFVIDTILDLYPDDPALGSPFGTGNETFGLSPEFKRGAAIMGDISMNAPRRQWVQAAVEQGADAFVYHFTDPQSASFPAFLGVPHGADVPYVYGITSNGPEATTLAQIMMDYWVSFATSLDPNDGLGNASRSEWTKYTSESTNMLELNSESLTMIPDTFRADQISFMNDNAEALLH